MKLIKLLLVPALCSLLAVSNKAFSQENPEDEIGHTGFYLGLEVGYVMNRFIDEKLAGGIGRTNGLTGGIYFRNPHWQLGFIAELNKNDIEGCFLGKGLDIGKVGFEADYSPRNWQKVIRPYVGSEIKYECETLFIPNETNDPKKNGVGLELKCGTEIKPFKNMRIRGYIEIGGNISAVIKKSKNYPENPDLVRDKFLIAAGLKF
jgi:hypothetical protein